VQAESQTHTMTSSLTASLGGDLWDHVRALASAITSTPSGCLFSMPWVSDQVRRFVLDVVSQGFIRFLRDVDVAVCNERVCFRKQFLEVLIEVAGKVEIVAHMARIEPCQRYC